MGKSKDKKVSREAKVDKKLALGVKRKSLKRKKDMALNGPVESEVAAQHATAEDKGVVRSKKVVAMKQKKKHIKLKSTLAESDDMVELLTSKKDETKLKNKKKSKKNLNEGGNPVEGHHSPSDRINAGTPKLKKERRRREGRCSNEPNNAEEVLHGNQDKEIPSEKIKKSEKINKKDKHASNKEGKMSRLVEVDNANVDEIESVDEDCSRGMKKWILEYKQKRPGLKVLQQRIDEFVTAHEEQQEQERKEREARAAEDGWTVVAHHKGRKKTTDTETGTAVGSVSLAAMQEKMANKKPKEIDMNFYRFQKREAHISELAMLQSKFEQDKKRIQQLRAQRKFKPTHPTS
uniref:Ribosomal RNA-processing protein 7 C-terminal domain-containing protein n=1 Tax=Leersia perrieri TaxID=77586 RepID=A0A0D9VAG9_9ORYZ